MDGAIKGDVYGEEGEQYKKDNGKICGNKSQKCGFAVFHNNPLNIA